MKRLLTIFTFLSVLLVLPASTKAQPGNKAQKSSLFQKSGIQSEDNFPKGLTAKLNATSVKEMPDSLTQNLIREFWLAMQPYSPGLFAHINYNYSQFFAQKNMISLNVPHQRMKGEPDLSPGNQGGYDTGNIVKVSGGSWIPITKHFSFVMDLPLYFYKIQYDNPVEDKIGNSKISVVERSELRGVELPLIYQVKVGMGIIF